MAGARYFARSFAIRPILPPAATHITLMAFASTGLARSRSRVTDATSPAFMASLRRTRVSGYPSQKVTPTSLVVNDVSAATQPVWHRKGTEQRNAPCPVDDVHTAGAPPCNTAPANCTFHHHPSHRAAEAEGRWRNLGLTIELHRCHSARAPKASALELKHDRGDTGRR